MTPELLTIKAAATRLGLSVWTIRKWVQNGKIESNKLGTRRLIPAAEVARLIKESTVPRC